MSGFLLTTTETIPMHTKQN